MNKIATNIVKGLRKKIFKVKTHTSFERISWLMEKLLKHEDDEIEKIKKLNNLEIHYLRPYELLHTYSEIFTNEIYKFIPKNESPVIIDCGANIGLGVLYFKSAYPNAYVSCYEPDKKTFAFLKKNVESNNLSNVFIHQKAVWVEDGFVNFEAKGSEASRINTSDNTNNTKISCVDFAAILSQYENIDLMKMDIEGAEYEVIVHCKNFLNRIDNMFIEYHGSVSNTARLNEMLQIFAANNFDVYIKNAADNLQQPFVSKKSSHGIDVQLNIFCYKKS